MCPAKHKVTKCSGNIGEITPPEKSESKSYKVSVPLVALSH